MELTKDYCVDLLDNYRPWVINNDKHEERDVSIKFPLKGGK